VECIQPILRLLEVAGITPKRPDGYQWYGRTSTVWDIPKTVKERHSKRGFYFEEDQKLLEKIIESKKRGMNNGCTYYAHNSDVREIHFHRQVDRVVKPFGMSYARIELA